MSAHEQIRELLARYAHVHDDTNADGLAATFTENGSLTSSSGETANGRAAITEFMSRIYARRRADGKVMKHMYTNAVIQIHGSTADATTDFVAYERLGDGPWAINMIGQVRDRLVFDSGRWLFVERRIHNVRPRTDR